jgi:Ca2+:H+ antiporter
MVRRILFASVALAPIVVLIHYLFHPAETVDFVLAAAALIPLAWLIGEATEHAAEHTGPGIGGFLNATFGNAPELIIALFAVNAMEFEVVRGSLTGSVVGNLLLVLGFSLLFGGRGEIDRPSSFLALALVAGTTLLLLIPSIPGWEGDPERDELVKLSIPVSVVLLIAYVVLTWYSLRRHAALHIASDAEITGWSLRLALLVLGLATVVTALVAEILVGSIDKFAEDSGLSEFFLAAVVIAIVGNAAEHGGAVVVAARGKIKLAAEIALASSAQVAVFLIPAVCLLALLIEQAQGRAPDRRLRRRRDRVLSRRRPPGGLERRRLAPHRIGREVQLLDLPGRVADDAQQLAALAALDAAEAILAVWLEVGRVASGHAAEELRLQPTLPPREHDLVALGPPRPEQRLDRGGRRVARLPRIGRRR